MTRTFGREIAPIFDDGFYLSAYPDVAKCGVEPLQHFIQFGWMEGRNPNAWFDINDYLDRNPTFASSTINPLYHYLGLSHLREAEALNDPAERAVRDNIDFEFYCNSVREHTSLKLVGRMQAAYHYLGAGHAQDLDPTPWFSTSFYKIQNADVVASGINAFAHYILYGKTEGRLIAIAQSTGASRRAADVGSVGAVAKNEPADDPNREGMHSSDVIVPEPGVFISPEALGASRSEDDRVPDDAHGGTLNDDHTGYVRSVIEPHFSRRYYLMKNPDVEAAGVDPLDHFVQVGWAEGRDPSAHFSTLEYLEMYPDVAAAKVNPLYHYIAAGAAEGRTPKSNLGFRFDVLKDLKSISQRVEDARNWCGTAILGDTSRLIDGLTNGLARSGGRRVFLSISHDNFLENFGGVQLCLTREAFAFEERGFDQIHIYPAVPITIPDLVSVDPSVGVIVNSNALGVFPVSLVAKAVGERMASAPSEIRRFAVHSLLGHSPVGVSKILKAGGFAKGYFWLHDYASLCANYNLMRNDVEYCGVPSPSSNGCKICIHGDFRKDSEISHNIIFENFDVTAIAPSRVAREIWTSRADYKTSDVIVLEHCRLEETEQSPRALKDRIPGQQADRPLRVAFLGLPSIHKGWPAFRDLAFAFENDPRYQFYHLGKNPQREAPIHFVEVEVGSDRLDAMSAAVREHRIDIAVIWSLWPETFCLTAFEALAGGAKLIAHRDGGNVVAVCAEADQGRVLDDERELLALFAGMELDAMRLARGNTISKELVFSSMTAELIEDQVS